MISAIINGILKLITKMATVLLLPLDLLAESLLPQSILDSVSSIVYYLNLPVNIVGWVFQLVHIPTTAISLIVSYWVFKYAIVGATSGIKKVITLYQRFKI